MSSEIIFILFIAAVIITVALTKSDSKSDNDKAGWTFLVSLLLLGFAVSTCEEEKKQERIQRERQELNYSPGYYYRGEPSFGSKEINNHYTCGGGGCGCKTKRSRLEEQGIIRCNCGHLTTWHHN